MSATEAAVLDDTAALAASNVHPLVPVAEPQPPIALGALTATSGRELIASATEMATELARVIHDQRLSERIQGKEYVKVEGWTTLATMLGVLPVEVANTFDPDTGIYVAKVELRRMDNAAMLTSASAECGGDDDWTGKPGGKTWSDRPRPARRSMATTRATSKACRISFSWVMALAGYSPTPREEVPDGGFDDADGNSVQRPAPPPPTTVLSAQETVTVWEARLLDSPDMAALATQWPDAQRAAKVTGDKSVLAELANAKDRRKAQLTQPIEGEVVEREPGTDDDEVPY